MQILSKPEDLQGTPRSVSAAIGVFDGVHLGHQAVIRRLLETARTAATPAVVLTFHPHPGAVIAPDRTPPAIQSLDHRLRSLAALGVDATWVIAFDEPFSRQSGETFVRSLIRGFGDLHSVHVGSRFTFGHQRSGNVSLLRRLGRDLGFTVHPVEPVTLDGAVVSSTRLRHLIAAGQLEAVTTLLGRPYSLAGTVQPGNQLGRRLGTPTANLDVAGLILPPYGVYVAQAVIDGQPHPAVANLGLRPTVTPAAHRPSLEVHLLDIHPDLYHRPLEVRLLHQLRPEITFPSLAGLTAQIQRDIAAARRFLAQQASP